MLLREIVLEGGSDHKLSSVAVKHLASTANYGCAQQDPFQEQS